MYLSIEKETLIKDIQREFNASYPYLKLEFFRSPHPENKLSAKAGQISSDEALHKITRLYEAGKINMDGNRTVTQLEQDFWEIFGFSAQVFRKSGNLWIETSLTDSWTLDKQNDVGKSFRTFPAISLSQKKEDEMIDTD